MAESNGLPKLGRGDYPVVSQVAAEVAGDGQARYMGAIRLELGAAFLAAAAGAGIGPVSAGGG